MPSHVTYTHQCDDGNVLNLYVIDDIPSSIWATEHLGINYTDLNALVSQAGYTIAPIQPPSPQEELLPLHRRRHNS